MCALIDTVDYSLPSICTDFVYLYIRIHFVCNIGFNIIATIWFCNTSNVLTKNSFFLSPVFINNRVSCICYFYCFRDKIEGVFVYCSRVSIDYSISSVAAVWEHFFPRVLRSYFGLTFYSYSRKMLIVVIQLIIIHLILNWHYSVVFHSHKGILAIAVRFMSWNLSKWMSSCDGLQWKWIYLLQWILWFYLYLSILLWKKWRNQHLNHELLTHILTLLNFVTILYFLRSFFFVHFCYGRFSQTKFCAKKGGDINNSIASDSPFYANVYFLCLRCHAHFFPHCVRNYSTKCVTNSFNSLKQTIYKWNSLIELDIDYTKTEQRHSKLQTKTKETKNTFSYD